MPSRAASCRSTCRTISSCASGSAAAARSTPRGQAHRRERRQRLVVPPPRLRPLPPTGRRCGSSRQIEFAWGPTPDRTLRRSPRRSSSSSRRVGRRPRLDRDRRSRAGAAARRRAPCRRRSSASPTAAKALAGDGGRGVGDVLAAEPRSASSSTSALCASSAAWCCDGRGRACGRLRLDGLSRDGAAGGVARSVRAAMAAPTGLHDPRKPRRATSASGSARCAHDEPARSGAGRGRGARLDFGASANGFVPRSRRSAARRLAARLRRRAELLDPGRSTAAGGQSGLIDEDGAIELGRGGFSIEPFVVARRMPLGWADAGGRGCARTATCRSRRWSGTAMAGARRHRLRRPDARLVPLSAAQHRAAERTACGLVARRPPVPGQSAPAIPQHHGRRPPIRSLAWSGGALRVERRRAVRPSPPRAAAAGWTAFETLAARRRAARSSRMPPAGVRPAGLSASSPGAQRTSPVDPGTRRRGAAARARPTPRGSRRRPRRSGGPRSAMSGDRSPPPRARRRRRCAPRSPTC